jgi:hypothetical protein
MKFISRRNIKIGDDQFHFLSLYFFMIQLFLIINYHTNILTSLNIYSLLLAYVCGDAKDGHGILRETPFEMGQSLKEDFKLDIHKEMDLLERKLAELQAMNVDENTINCVMKDYGMERFIKFLIIVLFLFYSFLL